MVKYMRLHTLGATLVGNRVYFASCDFNGLFCMDLEGKWVVYKARFEKYAKSETTMFGKQILYRDKIYFIPVYGDRIAVYDLMTEEVAYIEIRERGDGPIRDAFIDGNDLWMFYARCPANIFKINLITKRQDLISFDWNTVYEQTGCSKQMMFDLERGTGAKQIGKHWWVFAASHGYLMDYDWGADRINAYSFPQFKEKMIVGAVREKVWIMARDEDKVLEYDYGNRTEKWLRVQEISRIPGDVMRMIEQDEYLFFIKCRGMAVVNKESGEARYFMFSREKNLMTYVINEGKMILLPTQGKGLAVFRFSDCSLEEYDFEWEESLTDEILEKYFSGYLSDGVCELREFVNFTSGEKGNNDQNSGRLIWNTLSGKQR